jgi:hypothetical protein
MSILTNIDEAAEPKPTLYISGTMLGLLKLENPQLGQCIKVCAELCIEGINAYKDEKGNPNPAITFTVESLVREEEEPDPMQTIKNMYPGMAQQ